MDGPNADLALIADAAAEAGQIALRYWKRDPEVFWKGNSPVSEADFAVDDHLRKRLLDARPHYGWISEETEARAAEGDEERFFVVDPIDGTRSFLRGETTWCVSIAVVAKGRPVAGVIDVPALKEVFTAEAHGPARLGGEVIAVSGHPDARLRLSMPGEMRQALQPQHGAKIDFAPSVPSLAYRLALVACGRLDGTLIGARANDWDIAAGDLILERAGGILASLEGRHHLYNPAPKRHGVLVAGARDTLGRLLQYGSATA